ncbi:MAG: DUF4381 domain-containing protein [Gammaproteobacteria bacterium]|nr:DUF4381 domain-containing protein [Gammaproteobacteria bacterium]
MQPAQQPLALKDIHLPDTVSWWPPAVGYWLILGLIVLLILCYFAIKFLTNRRRIKKQALAEFKKIHKTYQSDRDQKKLLKAVSVLLRRAAISCYPRSDCASLTGNDWLTWLDQQLPAKSTTFSDGPGYLLTEFIYSNSVNTDDLDALLSVSRQWLNQLPAPAKHHPPTSESALT